MNTFLLGFLPGVVVAILGGYMTYRFNVRAEHKRQQLQWLLEPYQKILREMKAFYSGNQITVKDKEDAADRVLQIYAEIQLYASSAVVKSFGILLDAFMKGEGDSDYKRDLYRKLILAMRKQLQGKFWDWRIRKKDIRFYSLQRETK